MSCMICYILCANQKDQLIEPNLIKKTLQVVAHKGSSQLLDLCRSSLMNYLVFVLLILLCTTKAL